MMLSLLVVALALHPAGERAGCLSDEELLSRISKIKEHGFSASAPLWVASEWPVALTQTGMDRETGQLSELTRQGRLIDGVLRCGESYAFATRATQGVGLRAFSGVTIADADRATWFAARVLSIVKPPPGSEASGLGVEDGARPVRTLVNSFWQLGNAREALIVTQETRGGDGVVVIRWTRDRIEGARAAPPGGQ